MSGLVLKLGPKERILVNGAVIENGDRRSRFTVLSSGANILRLKDAIHPDSANTPVRRACYLTQLLLSGDVDTVAITSRLENEIVQLMQVFAGDKNLALLVHAAQSLNQGNPYACLKALRKLLSIEASLLSKQCQHS
ncbi:flagellar biosynthesis repressor FlbT [Marivita sp. S2033]|uniref:flagellar biosynthesis repressor FlbT n=1 Tax=Marivita sp. S2033 TaxID=3373187 RepID=UPI003982D55F